MSPTICEIEVEVEVEVLGWAGLGFGWEQERQAEKMAPCERKALRQTRLSRQIREL